MNYFTFFVVLFKVRVYSTMCLFLNLTVREYSIFRCIVVFGDLKLGMEWYTFLTELLTEFEFKFCFRYFEDLFYYILGILEPNAFQKNIDCCSRIKYFIFVTFNPKYFEF